jgi:hypothetical protein
MKKIFAILMVVSVLGAMIGCSGEKTDDAAATAGATAGATTGTETPK